MTNKVVRKLVGEEEERAVSPVIGVILMVAITVILAAVIAAFVLDIGPGEADPTGSVDISGDATTSVTVTLESTGGNADGVAIVSEDDEVEDADIGENDVFDTISISGDEVTITDGDLDDGTDLAEFTVRAYTGELESEDDVGDADTQAIIDEFEVEQTN